MYQNKSHRCDDRIVSISQPYVRPIIRGKLDKPVAVYSRDELGNLSIAFNNMMQQLKATIAEKDLAMDKLSELNATLEDRVSLRTTELEISETRIRTVLDNVGEGIIVIDENGLIISLNPAAKNMFGANDTECIGMHFIMLLLNQSIEGLSEVFGLKTNKKNIFKEYINRHSAEIQGQRMDGSVFPMELVITSMRLGEENMHACITHDITRRKEAELHLAEAQNSIVNAAHKSGMAEMAIGVLHNIGNILNSVNISVEEVSRIAGNSKVQGLNKANAMLCENMDNLYEFISNDNKGKKLLQYYVKLGSILEEELNQIIDETKSLREKTTMMKEVISTQQAYATTGIRVEEFQISPVIEDALKVQGASLHKWGINITKNIPETPTIVGQKSKLLQVVTNLIKNAKEATLENDARNKEKEIIIDIGIYKNKSVYVSVTDNGVGIKEENLSNIFNHGFTTKENGHGFGLHTSANSMTEMGGMLTVSSDGANKGACFTLSVPIADSERQDESFDDVVLSQKRIAEN